MNYREELCLLYTSTRTVCDHPDLFSEVGIFSGFLRDFIEGKDVYKRQGRTIPGKAEIVYLLDYRCSFLVNDEIFVLVHEVAIHLSLIHI